MLDMGEAYIHSVEIHTPAPAGLRVSEAHVYVAYMLRLRPEVDIMASQAFWADLEKDLEDPAFLREFIVESMRIATIDAIVNTLDDAREAAGLSKAELARAIGAEPATVRRLFSSEHVNPTLGTLAEVASALGMRVTLEPLPEVERRAITQALREGRASRIGSLARHLERIRATPA